jgi:hypothetical protein
MTISRPVYATRETVKRALDIRDSARVNDQVDRLVESSSVSVEGDLHRVFYPRIQTLVFNDWNSWLDDKEIVSISTLMVGGVSVGPSDYVLDPPDGPPFNHLSIANSILSYSPGSDVWLSGVYGYTLNTRIVGTLSADISSSIGVLAISNGAGVGIGDLLIIGSEYLLVIDRGWIDSSQNLQASLSASVADTGLVVTDGGLFARGETVMLETEQCLILDIVGNTLVVRRAWEGTVLAPHGTVDVYVSRSLTVDREVSGTASAAHTAGVSVRRWVPPSLVTQLTIAETLTAIEQEGSAYARVVGSGESVSEARGVGLADLRSRALTAHGRKNRIRSV